MEEGCQGGRVGLSLTMMYSEEFDECREGGWVFVGMRGRGRVGT